MSILKSFRSSFQIVNLSAGSGGAGIAVWRDLRNLNLYVATAYHVVDGMTNGLFIDYSGKKYTNFNFIILDKLYDFALVELIDVPQLFQVTNASELIIPVRIADRTSTAVTHGTDIYVIGWPLLIDSNSVSSGTIRSPKWNMNGIMNQILISAPIFGGNSGGGVFLKQSHELVGIVSWGLRNNETINGIVPHTTILDALFYFMYRPTLVTPSRVTSESYLLGISGYLIDPFIMQYNIKPTLSPLNSYGCVGIIVISVLPNSPASNAEFSKLIQLNNKYTYDIIWGVRIIGSEYLYITEENSLDSILYKLSVTPAHNNRKILPVRPRGETIYSTLDIVLPSNLIVECLVSRVVNNIPDNVFINKRVTLVKRETYYNLNGDNIISFGNKFMCGTRNDINKQFEENEFKLNAYGDKCLDTLYNKVILQQE